MLKIDNKKVQKFQLFDILLHRKRTIFYGRKRTIIYFLDKQYYFLMVAIMSDAQEFAIRDIIRQTWLKLYNKGPKKKKHFFIIGIKNTPADTLSKLKDEQMLYNDLAFLEDHVESYNNLARKTADTMRFMSKHYLFDYLLKVDTDSFVRIKPLIDYLIVLNHPRLYLGYMDGKSPVRRGDIKWKETDWNFCDLYIPYHVIFFVKKFF